MFLSILISLFDIFMLDKPTVVLYNLKKLWRYKMISGKTLEKYAELVIKIGVNLQKGQGLEIACPVEKYHIAHALAEAGYKAGAKIVKMRWMDEAADRLNFIYADTATLCDIPKYEVDSRNYLVENNFCRIAVAAEDPSAFKGLDAEKIGAYSKARSKAIKKYSDQIMSNGIRWCVVSVPTLAWAKQVFPNSKDPEKDLSNAIESTMRLNCEDPVKEWATHIATLEKRAEFLNKMDFEYVHFKNQKGTDLMVGLADGHKWQSANELAKDGIKFVANMPTEEVFTAPHRLKVDGILKSALPLCENGEIIDNFEITFKRGKIVSYTAECGYQTLKQLINTDSGTLRLGEIALIGKNSPISKLGILFYNTLFDENASCHLAIGKAYPTNVFGGDKMSKKELKARGVNDSTEHVDFMIGTFDLCVTGIKKDGEKIPLFIDGEWVI